MRNLILTIRKGKANRKDTLYGNLEAFYPDGSKELLISATAEYVLDQIMEGRFSEDTITVERAI